MGECKLGDCCWCNCGKYNGLVLALFCMGFWCCNGESSEETHDDHCCYCYDWIGFGCNCFWLGCVSCVPDVAKEISINSPS